MKIEKFEDIEAWKKSRELTKEIYRITKQRDFACDNAMRDQIRRAVIPISSNIADGFEREGNKEFTQFPSIAKGSCGEVRSQLYLAFDQQCISAEKHHGLNQECLATSRLISGLIKYLRQSELRGSKYR
jgi:four helix bundle protein